MQVKSIVSAIALSAAMMFSGSAFAQTVVGGVEVSADDVQAVTDWCTQLVTTESTASAVSDTTETTDEAGNAPAAGDAAEEDAPEVSGIAAATTTSIDLSTITVEECKEAGLGGAM